MTGTIINVIAVLGGGGLGLLFGARLPERLKATVIAGLGLFTAASGVILIGLALSSILEIKKIRMGNFLPALAVAPLIMWILSLLRG